MDNQGVIINAKKFADKFFSSFFLSKVINLIKWDGDQNIVWSVSSL